MTPRKRYFRMADAVGHKAWSNDELAAIVRLASHMHERWSRDGLTPEQANTCYLSPSDCERLSGKRRRDVAVTLLERLGDVVEMSARRDGDVLVIHWPKFADFQGLGARGFPETRPEIAPPVPVPDPVPDLIIKKESRAPIAARSQATWLTPFGDAWTAQYGDGSVMPYRQASRALRSLTLIHGEDETLRRWKLYLSGTAVAFASAEKFKQGFGQWSSAGGGTAKPQQPALTSAAHKPFPREVETQRATPEQAREGFRAIREAMKG